MIHILFVRSKVMEEYNIIYIFIYIYIEKNKSNKLLILFH